MAEAADAPSVRYQTVRRLAVGGMGEIFLARERGRLGFSRLVVIKRMLPELARRRDFVDMFVDEARIVGHLSHPNICQILELGEEDGVPFLALEYVRGDSLSGIWDRALSTGSSVPRAVTLRILADTAWALHYAHEACDADGKPLNVIHRDISPHNVMVSFFGDVKLMDFGIARADNRMHRTDTGKVKGKISYMAPEQLRGQPLDRRADVFAVGVMLWELTLSRRLFGGGGEVETLQKAIACEVPRPRTIDPTYPEELEEIVMRALASNRDARTPTAGELARALRTQLAKLGGAERVDLAALMTHLYPTESAAGDDVIPTLSWIEPVDTETHEQTPSSENAASALAPRPTVPLKTPTPPNDIARPTMPLATPTPVNDAGALVPRPTAPMRTPNAGVSMRPAGTLDDDPRPTLPLRTPNAGVSPAGTLDDDPRPTLPLRTPNADNDARPTLPHRSADDARPTLPHRSVDDARATVPVQASRTSDAGVAMPQHATGTAGDSVSAAASVPVAPRRGRWGLGVAAVLVIAGAAIALVLANRGDAPGNGDIASTTGSSTENAKEESASGPTDTEGNVTGGHATTGRAPIGNAAIGSAATDSAATGNAATGNAATGNAATGSAATGNAATGGAAASSAATGNAATGNAATGSPATGNAATGNAATGGAAASGAAMTTTATGSSATADAAGDNTPSRGTGHGAAGAGGPAHGTRHGGGTQVAAGHPSAGTGSAGSDRAHGGGPSGGGTSASTHGGGPSGGGTAAGGGPSGGGAPAGGGPSGGGPSVSPTTAAASRATGTLAVASDQTGVVSIDGVRAKSTPYQTELAAGDHRVEVELVEGAGTLRASARVVAGSKTKCRVEKGALACVVSPR